MMNIKLIVSAALITITTVVIGQTTDNRENLRFGVKAGLNYSNIYDDKTEEFNADSKAGFAGGVFVSVPIGMYLGIQPEVLLSQKGFKGKGTLLGSEYELTRTTTYIDIPIQFAFKPSEFFTLLAGPQYSYLIKQKDTFNSSLYSYSQEQEFENDNIRKNIFGIVAGLDINIENIVIGARMAWDVQNNHGDGTSDTPRYKNTWFQGTIGFAF